MPKETESTSFTKDIQGRYLCNDIIEVNAWKTGGGRPFDILIIHLNHPAMMTRYGCGIVRAQA